MINISFSGFSIDLPSPEPGNQDVANSNDRVFMTNAGEINFKEGFGNYRTHSYSFRAIGVSKLRMLLALLRVSGGKALTITHEISETETDSYSGIIIDPVLSFTSTNLYCKTDGPDREHYSGGFTVLEIQ